MTTNNQPLARVKGPSTLARAKFGPGMLLQHEDLEQLNVYTRELNRLMFRSFFGCGVVCGLVVGTDSNCGKVCVTVGSGLALDCQGAPIYVPKSQKIDIDEECSNDVKGPLWVVLCGAEKCCSPRTSTCSSDDEETTSSCTRERDWFEIRIVGTRPKCACSCEEPKQIDRARDARDVRDARDARDDKCACANPEHPCYSAHYLGECGCECEDCVKCDCDCVLLARLDLDDKDPKKPEWNADHRVRRFVRPILMRDPQVWKEEEERKKRLRGDEKAQEEDPRKKRDLPAKKS